MLNQEAVNEEEERLRLQIAALAVDERKAFYTRAKRELKDPDTYAALNWFFVTGIHHFYLGKWLQGALDLLLFLVGLLLALIGYPVLGIALIAVITVIEFWALFRSQIIIQDWNNQRYKKILKDIKYPDNSRDD